MIIEFDMDNAAFDDDFPREVSQVLGKIAAQFSDGAGHGPVYDSNGNRIGDWKVQS